MTDVHLLHLGDRAVRAPIDSVEIERLKDIEVENALLTGTTIVHVFRRQTVRRDFQGRNAHQPLIVDLKMSMGQKTHKAPIGQSREAWIA